MATLTALGGAGVVTLTGTGYTGSEAVVTVAYTATGRRFNEMRRVPVVAGAISAVLTVPFAGSVTARAVDPAAGTVQATTGTATVT